MNRLGLYHRLPSFMKDIVVSGYGLAQKRRRYGGMFQKFVQQLEESQWYSLEQQKEYQDRKLKLMLIHCSENVPYYRILFNKLDLNPKSEEPLFILSRLPVLDKQTVRRNTNQFVADNISKRNILTEHTSGSTGTPLKIYYTEEAHQFNYALGVSRCKSWAGIVKKSRKVMFGGRLVVPISQRRPPYWVNNIPEKQLYCSSYHLSENSFDQYYQRILRFKPQYLMEYTSALHLFANYLIERKLHIPDLKAILTSCETLTKVQRETMEIAYKCKVFDSYSLTEYVNYISECEDQTLHISPEAGIVEILDNCENEVIPGEVGEIISTTLFNFAMPLLRYRTSDMAVRSAKKCKCGRELPTIEKIIGRIDDIIKTPEGEFVGRLDPVLKGVTNIIETQIIQQSIGNITVKLVPGSGYSNEDGNLLVRNLSDRLGKSILIKLEEVADIPRGPNGKLKTVISLL